MKENVIVAVIVSDRGDIALSICVIVNLVGVIILFVGIIVNLVRRLGNWMGSVAHYRCF